MVVQMGFLVDIVGETNLVGAIHGGLGEASLLDIHGGPFRGPTSWWSWSSLSSVRYISIYIYIYRK